MQFITLISDWSSSDYYIGAVKGRIYGICSNVQVVDVNHQIMGYNINQTAFILKNSYKNFPSGSIHIVAVNSETSSDKPYIAVEYNGHFFIGTDNGLFYLVFEGVPTKIIEIGRDEKECSFPELEVFAVAAARIANGETLDKLGPKREKLFRQLPMLPSIEDSVIIGKVIYIDSYQNIITNVDKETFEKTGQGRSFIIYVQSKGNRINKINKTYNESPEGELLALFNSAGNLEIAVRKGKVAELFNLTTSSTIRIEFEITAKSSQPQQKTLF
ncbi:MAG: SAM-dependent chlorinase/fluorinase [Bacteroidales bacterium]